MARVGWIGLGKMGAPMAGNLLAAGHVLTVWNRSPGRADALAAAGATVAAQPAEAAKAETVFCILADDAALRDALLGPDGAIAHMPAGAVLVEMSTVSPAISAEIARACEAGQLGYIRAPVSGSVALATAGTLTVLASGPDAAFARVQPLLAHLSARQLHVGQGCEARVLKLVINMMVATTAAMTAEAVALGLKHGLDRATMLDTIAASVVGSPLIGYKVAALKARDYTPAFEAQMMGKDLDLALGAARANKTPLPLTSQVREGLTALAARGDGGADFFKYVELATHLAGLDAT